MKRLTTEDFIKKAKQIHKNKYDYSKSEYINSRSSISIICPIHGEFTQRANDHLSGYGCPYCGGTKKLTTQEFIEKAKKVHKNKYDYEHTIYYGNDKFLNIICPIHGEFTQRANDHLSGYGCPYCGGTKKLTTQEFIEKAKKVHKNKYDYSKVEYENTDKKVCIVCKKHGEFWQTPHNHLKKHGCPICNLSKLEDEIVKFLDLKSIKYVRQYKPLFLKHDKWQKSLDFYLPEYNIAIECQGIQHFKQVEFLCRSKINNPTKLYNLIINNDIIKYNLCFENGIKVVYYTKEKIKTDNLNSIYINNIYDNMECMLKYIKEYKNKILI